MFRSIFWDCYLYKSVKISQVGTKKKPPQKTTAHICILKKQTTNSSGLGHAYSGLNYKYKYEYLEYYIDTDTDSGIVCVLYYPQIYQIKAILQTDGESDAVVVHSLVEA